MTRSMEKIIKYILILVFLTSNEAFGVEYNLSFIIDCNNLFLEIGNNSDSKRAMLFKRGKAAIFLVSTKDGQLFNNKEWKLLSARSISNGLVSYLRSSKKRAHNYFSFISRDLKTYMPLEKTSLRPIDFYHLYIQAVIKTPWLKNKSLTLSPIYKLIIKDKQISEVRSVSETSVSETVRLSFEKELEKIKAEETSPEYGYH